MTPQDKSTFAKALVLFFVGLALIVKSRKRQARAWQSSTTGGSKRTGLSGFAVLAGVAVGYANAAHMMGAGTEDLTILVPGYFAVLLLALALYGCASKALNRLVRQD